MKKTEVAKIVVITVVINLFVTFVAIGFIQNSNFDPTAGCRRYDASDKWYGYDCPPGKKDFYLAK